MYLGLLFTTNLSWNAHITNIQLKAKKKLNMMCPLKFDLDRRSLETLFSSFVASTMFYGIEVWGGTYDSHLLKLEQIVVDGMRLVCGATKRSNISKLYEDTGWQSVKERRDQAMVIMLYKIKHNIAPTYLHQLLPQDQPYVHNLRSKKVIREMRFNTEVFKRSFFPTAVRLWNSLDRETQNSGSINILRNKLRGAKEKPTLYYYGKRWPAIHHARLRIGCSKLNYHVCFNLHIPDVSPDCSCGEGYENSEHFLMECKLYNDIRNTLKRKIERHCIFTLDVLLHGAQDLPLNTNYALFDAVHEYILESHRFE